MFALGSSSGSSMTCCSSWESRCSSDSGGFCTSVRLYKCLEREREREREAYVRLRKTRYVCEWERERERERERCDVMCWLCCAVVNYNNVLWLEYWRSIGVLQSHPCTQDRLCICVRLEASTNRMDWAWQQLKFIQKEFYLRAHLYLPRTFVFV